MQPWRALCSAPLHPTSKSRPGLLLPPALHHTQDPTSKFEVRHQIGRGSFGSAFLVTNKQDKAEYVLKRVRLAKQTNWQRNSTLQERKLVRRANQNVGVLQSVCWPQHHQPAVGH